LVSGLLARSHSRLEYLISRIDGECAWWGLTASRGKNFQRLVAERSAGWTELFSIKEISGGATSQLDQELVDWFAIPILPMEIPGLSDLNLNHLSECTNIQAKPITTHTKFSRWPRTNAAFPGHRSARQ
jgi:hypothetical protein